MQTTWIVAADGSRARIFETDDSGNFYELEELVNPEGRMKNGEINTDQDGRFATKGMTGQSHTSQKDVSPKDHEVELFTKHLGHELDKACSDHRFDKLCLVAPAKFIGMVRDNLADHTRQAVSEEIVKDVSWFSSPGVEQYLRQHCH
jgi:protein required for attachment to host cells